MIIAWRAQDLLAFLNVEPFRPLLFVLNDQRTYVVNSPDKAWVGKCSMVIAKDDGALIIIPLAHIRECIKRLPPLPPPEPPPPVPEPPKRKWLIYEEHLDVTRHSSIRHARFVIASYANATEAKSELDRLNAEFRSGPLLVRYVLVQE